MTFEALVLTLRDKKKSQKLQKLIPSDIAMHSRECEDAEFGVVIVTQNDIKHNIEEEHESVNSDMILVLESPHEHEYKITPPKAARHTTGTNIKKNLKEALQIINYDRSSIPAGKYNVKVTNAIRYQASLGENTEIWRTTLALAYWHAGGRDDFYSRIKNLINEGTIVLNCCTKTKKSEVNKNVKNLIKTSVTPYSVKRILKFFSIERGEVSEEFDLSELVESEISGACDTLSFDVSCFRLYHPSRWNRYVK